MNMKSLTNLNFDDAEVRRDFIRTTESGLYAGINILGQRVIVELDRGIGMDVKVLNEKGWFECVEYNRHGFYQCDWVEKAGEHHPYSREEKTNEV